MRSFQPVLAKLEKRRANIRRLVTSFSDIAAAVGDDRERLASLTTASHETLEALATRDDELDATLAQLPGLTKDLKSSMTSVDTLSTELDPTLTYLVKSADELHDALDALGGTVKALRKFVKGRAQGVPNAQRGGGSVSDLI